MLKTLKLILGNERGNVGFMGGAGANSGGNAGSGGAGDGGSGSSSAGNNSHRIVTGKLILKS